MYGTQRWHAQNVIQAAHVTAGSQASGILSGAQKTGTGSALLAVYGLYTGSDDLLITVQISDVSAGTDIGQARYRWRTNQTAAGTWEGTNILTHATGQTLTAGILMRWIAGTGVNFAVGDVWTFRALAAWGPSRLLDWRRDTYYRSGELASPNTLTINHGTPVEIDTLIIYDHNLTGAATATFKAHAADAWATPAFSQALTIADPLVLYLMPQTYQYRRLEITDAANPDSEIRIGGLYMGSYIELTEQAEWSSSNELAFNGRESRVTSGVTHESVETEQHRIALNYSDLPNADADTLAGILRTLKTPATRQARPCFFHLFSDEPDTLMLARVSSSLPRNYAAYGGNALTITLEEVPQTIFQ